MLRRFQTTTGAAATRRAAAAGSSSASMVRGLQATSVRQFHSVVGLMGSCIMCGACMLCFGSWANNFCNVRKYGRWRFRNSIDDVIMVSDFRGARYIGAFIGFLFWWFIVGPQKYRYNSNLEEVPGNKRFGPF